MPDRPNILFMICHDLGRHLCCYGVDTVDSPSIDSLAAGGVRFANSFCTAPQCSPSRASIFTGRHPHNNGVMGLCHADFAWDLHPTERHLAGILREAGYHTALIGLQHERRQPSERDFAEIVAAGFCDKVAARSVEHLRAVADGDQPFYMQVGFIEPHRGFDMGGATPDESKGVTVPPYLVNDEGAREEFAAYQGAIRKMDAAVGAILEALDGLGLRENTITIFTSDHGIPFPRAKCSLYDPGLAVPFIIRWPGGGWTGGRIQEEMISNIDYLPTLLDALGIPAAENIQGRSFVCLLSGRSYRPRSEIFGEMTYHDYCDPRRCIRTDRYKLIANFTMAPFFMDPSQSWRPATITKHPQYPAFAYHPSIELYDLEKDPLEFASLVGDAEYAGVQKDLTRRLMGWMQETDDPLLGGIPNSPMHIHTIQALKAALE